MIGSRLKIIRTSKGITQKKLAESIGVTEVSVQRFEYGTTHPSVNTLIKIAEYFDVSLDYLVGRSDF